MYYRVDNFDPKCTNCNLSNGKAIPGQSEVPLNEVILIVVSAYPGNRELKAGITLAEKEDRIGIPDSSLATVGAGEYLRFCLEVIFDRDKEFPNEYKPIEKYTYFTNSIKCSPQRGRDKLTVKESNIKACTNRYLVRELESFPDKVPIFACAGEAVKALLGIHESITENRNLVNWYRDHPVIVSTNPVEWEKYNMKTVPDVEKARENILILIKNGVIQKYKKKTNKVIGSQWWKALPGSPAYFIRQDLELLKRQVINYIKETI